MKKVKYLYTQRCGVSVSFVATMVFKIQPTPRVGITQKDVPHKSLKPLQYSALDHPATELCILNVDPGESGDEGSVAKLLAQSSVHDRNLNMNYGFKHCATLLKYFGTKAWLATRLPPERSPSKPPICCVIRVVAAGVGTARLSMLNRDRAERLICRAVEVWAVLDGGIHIGHHLRLVDRIYQGPKKEWPIISKLKRSAIRSKYSYLRARFVFFHGSHC